MRGIQLSFKQVQQYARMEISELREMLSQFIQTPEASKVWRFEIPLIEAELKRRGETRDNEICK